MNWNFFARLGLVQVIKITAVFLISFIFPFLILPKPAFAANLLLNSSFENVEGGLPTSWTKNVSTVTLSTSTTVKSGTISASLTKVNGTTGSIYAYQDVDIDISSFYSLSGYAVKNDPNFSWVILRISWRDASLEISKTDSSQLTANSTDFQQLKIDSVQPPSQAVKARIELVANIASPNPSNPTLFDDIDFSQVSAPDQPTSTPTKTPTPTNTSIPIKTPTPTEELKAVTVAVVSDSAEILGESTDSALIFEEIITSAPQQTKIPKETKILGENNFATFAISTGIIFLGACGILAFRSYRKGKNDPFDSAQGHSE